MDAIAGPVGGENRENDKTDVRHEGLERKMRINFICDKQGCANKRQWNRWLHCNVSGGCDNVRTTSMKPDLS